MKKNRGEAAFFRAFGVSALIGLALVYVNGASAQSTEKSSFFGSYEQIMGSAGQYLTTTRYQRLLPTDYGHNQNTARHWNIIVDLLGRQRPENQLRLVHQFFNMTPYVEDIDAYHKQDYWASVGEFMDRGGDCEDFAIAKYRALVDSGFPAGDLRIVLVTDLALKRDHAVLTARLGDKTYVLDNVRNEVVEADQVTTYRPRYSLNQFNVWSHRTATRRDLPMQQIELKAE